MLTPNSILQNRYLIVRLLGEGGMGAVYEAIDQRVSCLVALKETRVGSSAEARQAFEREAALLANLRHPALPKVMDYFGEGEGEFLVMEHIAGHDLAELLALRNGPFPQDQVIRWADEILKLLEYLHTREPAIIHRDIKPANLKATQQGEVFLLDFGLAKGAAGQMATIQINESVRGYTPVYAPLEQIHGRGTDPRSDLYSLGATLYHLLTGQAPVSAPARFEALENGLPDPLKPANQLNFQISPEIAALVQKAMALSRRDRPGSAGEMRIALEHAARIVADRESARKAEAALIETVPGVPEDDPARPLVADNDVQFTVYTPQKIKPEKNYSVLAFAHLSKRRADAADDEPDPIEEMKDQAARILGVQRDDYSDQNDPSRQPVPRGGELTFVPAVQGLTFSPPSRSFTWRKSVHREEFDMWASREVDGQTLIGSMTVFLGSVVIAEVGLTISVDSQATSSAERISLDKALSARRVRQVFASYSHKDEQVVAELTHVAPIFGSRFLMDSTHLEPGEDRTEGLQRLIRNADVFQLFWSTNSMRSAEIVDEIRYAASLGRPGFILPTYWEDPLPRSPGEGLPPPEIERLHFHRIYPRAISPAGDTPTSRLVILGPAGAEVHMDDERQGSIGRSGRVVLKSIPPGRHVLRVAQAGEQDDERVIEIRAGADEQIFQAQFKSAFSSGISPSMGGSLGGAPDPAPATRPAIGSAATPRDDAPTRELPPMLDTIGAPAASYAEPVAKGAPRTVCTRCGTSYAAGERFCGRCGNTIFEAVGSMNQRTGPAVTDQMMAPAATVASAPPQNFQAPAVARRRKGLMMPIYAGAALVLLVMIVAPVWFIMKGTRTAPVSSTAPNPGLGNSNRSANANTTTTHASPPKTFTNSVGIEFVYVPSGTFMMGSEDGGADEKPVHKVTINYSFYIGKYEVTQAQWQSMMVNNPSDFKDCGGNCPVEKVSWDDAQKFIAKLNESNDGFSYRLPTEAEWEYACRAGTTGDYAGSLSEMAWYSENSGSKTHAVGGKQPNAWGLADMHGNVWEWCQDWYHETYYGAPTDGSAWLSGGEQKYRVLRGGSWYNVATYLRSANRDSNTPDNRYYTYGFRVVAVR